MNMWMLMIVFDTIAATVCFIIGVIIISPRKAKKHPWLMSIFIVSLLGLIVFMIGATVSHWYDISVSERIIFSGLAGLGLYMLYRGVNANKLLSVPQVKGKYIDDIGFILISLFEGFIIVALMDLSVPVWLIILGSILALFVGIQGIKIAKKHYL